MLHPLWRQSLPFWNELFLEEKSLFSVSFLYYLAVFSMFLLLFWFWFILVVFMLFSIFCTLLLDSLTLLFCCYCCFCCWFLLTSFGHFDPFCVYLLSIVLCVYAIVARRDSLFSLLLYYDILRSFVRWFFLFSTFQDCRAAYSAGLIFVLSCVGRVLYVPGCCSMLAESCLDRAV